MLKMTHDDLVRLFVESEVSCIKDVTIPECEYMLK